MSDILPNIRPLLYQFFSRMILVNILSVFAVVNLMYLNSEYEAGIISQSEMQTISTAFEILSLMLLVYILMPIIVYGYNERESIGGKVMLGAGFLTYGVAFGSMILG